MKFSEINASHIYFRLKDISGSENFLSKIRRFIKLRKKPMWNLFFNFFMLNIFSIKELLHKPSEIQWNITGILPGKLKRKIFMGFILQDITPWNHKNMRNFFFFFGGGAYFWGLGTNVELNGFFMILWISEISSLCLLVNFKLGFFIILTIFQG